MTDEGTLAGLVARGVVALDMETAAVARVCESRGVPWSVVRTISDRVADGLVGPELLELTGPEGGSNWPAVGRYVLARPSRLVGLMRLGLDSWRAASRAAKVAAAELDRA
jgi:hypothetical protein